MMYSDDIHYGGRDKDFHVSKKFKDYLTKKGPSKHRDNSLKSSSVPLTKSSYAKALKSSRARPIND